MGQKVFHNIGELDKYFSALHKKRPLVVCGKSGRRMDVYRHFAGLGAEFFQDFTPNPTWESAEKAAKIFRKSLCDCIVALGGGSAMDVAKCAKLWGGKDVPLIAVPTTAGTGSEATHFAVIYRDGEKVSVADERCLPDAVLFDPALLETLPEYHRKASMLDALCHGMESFWAARATGESRNYAAQAVQGVLKSMEAYLKNTPTGNAGMQQAAYLAGKAINLTQTTAGHAMCYKLTTIYGIAHGHAAALCNMALWPHMWEKGGAELRNTLSELAKVFGCNPVEEAIKKFRGIVSGLGLGAPAPSPGDYEILRSSVNAERLRNHPISLDEDEIYRLYHQILEG